MKMKVNGRRIRDLRLARSWSQEALAEQAGVSLRTIQRVETDGIASLSTRRALALALQINPVDLSAPEAGVTTDPADPETPPGIASPDAPDTDWPGKPKWRSRTAWGTSVAAATLVAAVIWLAQSAPEPSSETHTQPEIAVVDRGKVRRELVTTGTLEAQQIVQTRARIAGELKEILVAVGDSVNEGQTLANIDSETQALAVESARLGLRILRNQMLLRESEKDAAAANLETVRSAVMSNRDTRLGQPEMAAFRSSDSRSDSGQANRERLLKEAEARMLAATVALENLLLEVRQAESDLRQREVQLRYTDIRAPIAGTIISIDYSEGDLIRVDESQPGIAQIADLTMLNVVARIPEQMINLIDAGSRTHIRYLPELQRPDWQREVTLSRIKPFPSSSRGRVEFEAAFEIDNSADDLYAGMAVEVVIVTADIADALRIPRAALNDPFRDADGNLIASVAVLNPDGTTTLLEVSVGAVGNEFAEVLAGLSAGQQIVLPVEEV